MVLLLLIQHQLISSPCRSEWIIFSGNRQQHSFIYRPVDILVFALYIHGNLQTLQRALRKAQAVGGEYRAGSLQKREIDTGVLRSMLVTLPSLDLKSPHLPFQFTWHNSVHSDSFWAPGTHDAHFYSGPIHVCVFFPIFPFPALSSA